MTLHHALNLYKKNEGENEFLKIVELLTDRGSSRFSSRLFVKAHLYEKVESTEFSSFNKNN